MSTRRSRQDGIPSLLDSQLDLLQVFESASLNQQQICPLGIVQMKFLVPRAQCVAQVWPRGSLPCCTKVRTKISKDMYVSMPGQLQPGDPSPLAKAQLRDLLRQFRAAQLDQ